MKKSFIHTPHDKALFHALKNHKVARDAMRAYLPPEILSQANLDQLRMYKTKLVSPEYKEFEADIIYEIEMNSGKGLFLFHCELQSTVAKHMPLRVWQYLLLVLMEYAENHPKLPLPLVYPIIIYTGEAPYSATTNLFELFAAQKDLAKKFLSVFVKKVVASNKLKLPHPLRYFATYISVLFPQKTGNRPKIQAIKTSRIVA